MNLVRKTSTALLIAAMVFGGFAPDVFASAPDILGLDLVDIKAVEPGIVVDIKYATTDNFTGQVLYPAARCLLHESVAQRVAEAHRLLQSQGKGLKVFDCYRPLSVQKKMWAVFPDERYVANPASGSRHNRGASVDVGLIDSTGKEMPMPSGYDEFSERSHLSYGAARADELNNRAVLQAAMRARGFQAMSTEWWHFDAPDWKNYPLGDADMRLIPGGASQVIAVKEPRPGHISTEAWVYEKTVSGWNLIFGPLQVNVGRNGIAAFDAKREGDGKTPRGAFKLGMVFGYEPAANTRMPYRQATENDTWIDEPASPRYNTWVNGPVPKESHEKMRRKDDLYRLGIVIEYNTNPVVPGLGSAIFVHNWESYGRPTSGCVSFAPADLARIVAWLDPQKNPAIVVGFHED